MGARSGQWAKPSTDTFLLQNFIALHEMSRDAPEKKMLSGHHMAAYVGPTPVCMFQH